jgi:hypothetical protein
LHATRAPSSLVGFELRVDYCLLSRGESVPTIYFQGELSGVNPPETSE